MQQNVAHQNRVRNQVETVPVTSAHLLRCLYRVPRAHFLASQCAGFENADVRGGETASISLTLRETGLILDRLAIHTDEVVLEIGTESGYMTALLSYCAQHVYSIDVSTYTTQRAAKKLSALGRVNVTMLTGNALKGWRTQRIYDVIIINGSLPFLPRKLCEQLAVKGRLFAVVGQAPCMQALCVQRLDRARWQYACLFETDKPRLYGVRDLHAFTF